MIVIKIGGSIVDGLHASTLHDVQDVLSSDRLVIVHGGGKEVTRIAGLLGKEQRFVVSPGGIRSRYTDKETMEIFTMVMAGKINKEIVSMLLRHGVRAVGISGIDAGMIHAERKKKLIIVDERGRKVAIEGGYTGKITGVDTALLNMLISSNYTPVIAPVAVGDEYEMLNVDGDRAAAYVAGALKADRVLFMTDVNGLIMDGRLVEHLTLDEARRMLPRIGHGMEKKVLACTEALGMGVKEAIIASGKVENPISSALKHINCTVISNGRG
ncbi:MAG: [LysW]-aminoadipate/[LysW]-glutamate kinase [Candidatus Nitrosocaldus sp.]|nr:[LysW]-aminoadipate/[LysW]-glutamate kinase [Candidatus Nitrosocaldus sp.]MCS7140719.1 [LysW]-aminoadipate/[LysW]-glutamate kinase [Candidatus Nitrosocaldus sp.]MDW7999466.1 [LysW]-aminoadipate/[LysW]-glutamate kinase [Candidatus Nitrosocaldus sp.]MDW8275050.1 [LysW]-aminoadipate/[LysW]-glutamate kinase [Candidatus Nitrosocaldus sp.]